MARTRLIIALLAVLLAELISSPASTHALPERFEPASDVALSLAPSEVRILFGGEVESAFSTIRVTDATGRRVDRGDSHVDARNRRLLRVRLQPLGPGTYRVAWRVLAIDGHRNEGTYTFSVMPPD